MTLKGSDYGEGSLRFEQEPMEQMKNAGYSEQRYIFIDEEKGEATITYKYNRKEYKGAVLTVSFNLILVR